MRQTIRESFRIARERHAVKSLVALALVGAAALLGGGYLLASKTSSTDALARQIQEDRMVRDRETVRTTRALCALRDDLDRRVQSSQRFLAEHPNGIPGISPKVIRDGIANQTRTINALSVLKC